MSLMPNQIQEYNGHKGIWMYECIRCKKSFSSSQAIAGHTRCHFKDGWVKGTTQNKKFVKLSDFQEQLDSATILTISNQHVVSATTYENTPSNSHQLPNRGVQIIESLAARPSPQGLSSRRPRALTHPFKIRDLMVLARIRDILTGKKQEAISRILSSAIDQVKESRKKTTEVDVITIEDSDDESKTI
ncbi:hypothetical protein P3S67_023141 [Capsicum chacoense]|uniref:uncharacterized protein LOC107861056 n=1 Tax=Capsicum annuum TaxID=4072 RepID=UPI0007BFADC3|nr:uncharacterized protein LOC107861056 [Capsicum annuum]